MAGVAGPVSSTVWVTLQEVVSSKMITINK
jgi:hypothetical protein